MNSLLAALERLDAKKNEEWLAELNDRKKAELSFHDKQRADGADVADSNKKYYSVTHGVNDYVQNWIASKVKGKVFLDYACGNGQSARLAAMAGAELAVGIDISRVSIENARQLAAQEGLSHNTFFVQADCENTLLPGNSFDFALCCGMLHHLDLNQAIPELQRILKQGGTCLAEEALNYNPAIWLYRKLTPHLRTDWEKRHILSLRDVRFIRQFLDVQDIRYWHLAALLVTPFRNSSFFGKALAAGDAIDSVALRVWPIRLMAWMFTFEMVKH